MIGPRTPEFMAALWALGLAGVLLVFWHVRHQDRLDALDRPCGCEGFPDHYSTSQGGCV